MKRKMIVMMMLGAGLLTGCSDEDTSTAVTTNVDSAAIASAVSDIHADAEGNVTVLLADGRNFDLGNLKGEAGKDGVNGVDGQDGINGKNGKAGFDGQSIIIGRDGSNGTDGKNGLDGKDGKDGVSITDVAINSERHLIVTLSDGTTRDAGSVDFSAPAPVVPEEPSEPDPDEPESPDESTEVAAILIYNPTGTVVTKCSNIDAATYVVIPEGVVRINDDVFKGARKLKKIVFSSTIEELGMGAFQECPIEELILPGNIKKWGAGNFSHNSSLKKIIIQEGITEIPGYAFEGCKHLEMVELPEGLQLINGSAFAYSSISRIKFPEGMTTISSMSFNSCESLETIVFPKSLKKIESNAFQGCTALKELVFPDGVEEIQSAAFVRCTNLNKVTLPSSLKILNGGLLNGSKIEIINIPEKCTEIGKAFGNCHELKEVHIPESVTIIDDEAFYQCDYVSIYGKSGSYAETYANEHGIPFIAE